MYAQAHNPVEIQRLLPREKALAGFFTVLFFTLIYLQKIAFHFGAFEISIVLPVIFGSLGVMAIFSRLEVSAMRLLVYCLFFGAAAFSQLQVEVPYSAPSMLIMLLMYLPMVVMWRVSEEEHLRIMRIFLKLMLVPVGMVALQLASQMVFGLGNMPNIEKVLPAALLRTGYNYDNIIQFGQAFKRPNGLFFLEPSFISCFIGCALVIELNYFRRPLWMAIFGVGLVGTFAATGQVLVAVALPFLIFKQSQRMIALALLAAALGAVAMVAMGKGVNIARLGELGSANTSGYIRLVAPVQQLFETLARPDVLFTGAGAGNIDHSRSSPWPVTKLIYEYGALTAVSFALLLFTALWRTASKGLAIALFFIVNFTGGYLLEPVAMTLFTTLCCMPVIRPPERPRMDYRRSRPFRRSRREEPSAPGLAAARGATAATAELTVEEAEVVAEAPVRRVRRRRV
jgi:hypothetical protein